MVIPRTRAGLRFDHELELGRLALVITCFFRASIADDGLEISRNLPKDVDEKHTRACAESIHAA
jgi:hypothetical protein